MIEYEFNVLPGGGGYKEESFIFREHLEVNIECMGNQTLNKAFYAKSYQRLARKVIGKIAGNGSIDNLFTGIISLEESIIERILCVVGLYKREIKYS